AAQPGTQWGGPAGVPGVGAQGTGAPGGAGPFGYAVHDVDVRPAVRRRVAPEYPDPARRTGTQGRVVLRLLVDENGHARHVSVLEATPDGIFDQCALDAVTRWSFTPGRRDGKAVPTWVHLPLRFDLTNR
ncbi:energy transducer TonB, partial [Nitratidesulfovibrio liaohensis]|uniref:energy transducer TonB n=1 Tax=Nitratidesulfovibrio liaohensis TaxID=2604158 RepID=UPI00141F1254